MVTAQFLGAVLWALLAVDVCCSPVKRFNPGASSHGAAAYPRPRSKPGAPSRLHSPGHVPQGANSEEVAASPMFELEPDLVPSAGSGSVLGTVQSRGSAGRRKPAGLAQAGAGAQLPPEAKWLISSIFEETPEVESSSDLVARRAPPLEYKAVDADEEAPELEASSESFVKFAPQPQYQAGELSHYEKTSEKGNYESQIEEQGLLPPPPELKYPLPVPLPLDKSTSEGFVSELRPPLPPAGLWFFYPYYDYRFLAGNYPVGTYSHFSSSFEQGHDDNKEAHYVGEYLAPSMPVNTPLEVELPEVEPPPRAPAKSGPKRGAAAQSFSSLRGAKRPTYGGYAYWR